MNETFNTKQIRSSVDKESELIAKLNKFCDGNEQKQEEVSLNPEKQPKRTLEDVFENISNHKERIDKINDVIDGKCEEEKEHYEYVNHPKHYNNYDMEVIDMMVKIWGTKATAQFCMMNAYKYRMRMGTKPGKDESKEAQINKLLEDFEKEQWYLDMAKKLKSKAFDEEIDRAMCS